MSRPGFPVTIVEFQDGFATEEACRDYLFACRWPEGFRCRRCGGGAIGVMHSARRLWQCKHCGAQTSVTAGTVASYCTSRSKSLGWGRDVEGVCDALAAGLFDLGPERDA